MGFKTRKLCRQLFTAAFMLLLFLWCSSPLVKAADAYTLTVTTSGTGIGTVNSFPAGIACESGVSGGCSAVFTDLDPVTLTATSDWMSLFAGWSSPCSGTGDCVLTQNTDTGLAANFIPNLQAIVLGHSVVEYTTLTETYANADEGGTVAAHVYTFYEDLILNRPISIRFYGGVGSMYLTNVGFTTLQGTLEIQQGSVEVHSLIIQ